MVAVVLVPKESPKLHERLVIVPVELSVKLTVKDAAPAVGLPTKLAVSGIVPIPMTAFVSSLHLR